MMILWILNWHSASRRYLDFLFGVNKELRLTKPCYLTVELGRSSNKQMLCIGFGSCLLDWGFPESLVHDLSYFLDWGFPESLVHDLSYFLDWGFPESLVHDLSYFLDWGFPVRYMFFLVYFVSVQSDVEHFICLPCVTKNLIFHLFQNCFDRKTSLLQLFELFTNKNRTLFFG